MAVNKANASSVDVNEFLEKVTPAVRKSDAMVLLELMLDITGEEPKMWGPTIVGFGSYDYKYDSGREGTSLRMGFSPRKGATTLYMMPGFSQLTDELSKLGKHKTSVSCLYINKLADVDLDVLRDICAKTLDAMNRTYPV